MPCMHWVHAFFIVYKLAFMWCIWELSENMVIRWGKIELYAGGGEAWISVLKSFQWPLKFLLLTYVVVPDAIYICMVHTLTLNMSLVLTLRMETEVAYKTLAFYADTLTMLMTQEEFVECLLWALFMMCLNYSWLLNLFLFIQTLFHCRLCRDQSTHGISLVYSFPTFCDWASILCHRIQTVSNQRGSFHKVCCHRNGYGISACQVV
jgi:hypothetical protein